MKNKDNQNQDPFVSSETTDYLDLSESYSQHEEIEQEQQALIEIEEEKESEQKEKLETQKKDLKNFILNNKDQELPSPTITLVYIVQVTTEEGIPPPPHTNQSGKSLLILWF